jgi:DNA-binding MarR family transcriptional regulator
MIIDRLIGADPMVISETPERVRAATELDRALVEALETTIPRYNRALKSAFGEAESGERLTMAQIRALQAIVAAGTGLTTPLARQMSVAVPTMTAMIDGLVERGLVERRPDPVNRRQTLVLPTAAGRGRARRYQQLASEHVLRLTRDMTPAQKKRLLAAIEDLAAALDATGSSDVPRLEAQ